MVVIFAQISQSAYFDSFVPWRDIAGHSVGWLLRKTAGRSQKLKAYKNDSHSSTSCGTRKKQTTRNKKKWGNKMQRKKWGVGKKGVRIRGEREGGGMHSKGSSWSLLSTRRVAYIARSSRSSSTGGTQHAPQDKADREFYHSPFIIQWKVKL